MAALVIDRRHRIVQLLREHGEANVALLVNELEISEATLRRDLVELEQSGQVVRTFAGARFVEPASLVARTFGEKGEQMRQQKEWIGRAAAELIYPGMVVALDSGTTAWRVAAALKNTKPLTIITSALAPIEELGCVEGITIQLIGGRFRRENLDFTGAAAVEAYTKLRADIAIVGVDSYVPGKGAFSADEASGLLAGAIARSADRCIVVCDHTKFNARGCCLAFPCSTVDCILTDEGINKKTLAQLKKDGSMVMVAGGKGGQVVCAGAAEKGKDRGEMSKDE